MENQRSTSGLLRKPTISVLIAAYNAGGFLHRAVRSALAQTLPPTEVLIVDDASTDDTLAVANTLASEDSRVRIVSLPRNGGPAVARNAGLEVAQGDWVAILDADDAYLPFRLDGFACAIAGKETDIVLDNFLYFDSASRSPGSSALAVADETDDVDLYSFLAHARHHSDGADWGLLKPIFRRQFLNDHKLRYPDRCRHGEDFFLMFDALCEKARCILIRKPGYLYTTRESGLSRTTIDYDTMLRQMRGLLARPGIRADALLLQLLKQCIFDLNRLAVDFRLADARRRRSFFEIGYIVVTHVYLIKRAIRFALGKIRANSIRASLFLL
jgi:succinoglycan biosynthesis protein ExoO